MPALSNSFEEKEISLLSELRQIGVFRRGSLNMQYRKCGKKNCACNQEGHPGHGPQVTLTYKEDGKTKTRNLPSAAAVNLVRQQIRNRKMFNDWCKRWRELNENVCEDQLEEVLTEKEAPPVSHQKKRKRTSSKKSGAKSKG
jgi:hypothetical protein